jgi:hypothetical protein
MLSAAPEGNSAKGQLRTSTVPKCNFGTREKEICESAMPQKKCLQLLCDVLPVPRAAIVYDNARSRSLWPLARAADE